MIIRYPFAATAVTSRVQPKEQLVGTRRSLRHRPEVVLNVPKTELTGNRGGTDNSLTRIVMKPTHFIGGYAQLSFGFNYYGPTGSQRDEVTVVRKRVKELEF